MTYSLKEVISALYLIFRRKARADGRRVQVDQMMRLISLSLNGQHPSRQTVDHAYHAYIRRLGNPEIEHYFLLTDLGRLCWEYLTNGPQALTFTEEQLAEYEAQYA